MHHGHIWRPEPEHEHVQESYYLDEDLDPEQKTNWDWKVKLFSSHSFHEKTGREIRSAVTQKQGIFGLSLVFVGGILLDILYFHSLFLVIRMCLTVIWFCVIMFTQEQDHMFFAALFSFIFGLVILHADIRIHILYLFCFWFFVRVQFALVFGGTWLLAVCYLYLHSTTKNLLAPCVPIANLLFTIAGDSLEKADVQELLNTRQLRLEQQRTEKLLTQLIPKQIQGRYMIKNNRYAAVEKECVSVLFSDLVAFTAFSGSIDAFDLVRFLNRLYAHIDDCIDRLEVYKVETIGDAFFVSSNWPIVASDHADRLVRLAAKMIEEGYKLEQRTANGVYVPKMRIGIHTGKVVAGVVGIKFPRYHLFGETVVIAECLERSGEPSRTQISDSCMKCLSRRWRKRVEPRKNLVEVEKLSRSIQTYFVKYDDVG